MLLHHALIKLDINAGTRLAAAKTDAAATGLRLCGMVDEPPRPLRLAQILLQFQSASSKTSHAPFCLCYRHHAKNTGHLNNTIALTMPIQLGVAVV
jgi:hypothetical protein